MITHFWDWLYTSVGSAISTLNRMVQSSELSPFFALLLVVVGIAVIIKYILSPLLGSSLSKASDEARKDIPKDAEWRKIN